jgi:hypothetical protein
MEQGMSENTLPPEPSTLEELTAARDHCGEVIEYLTKGQSSESRGLDVYDHFAKLAPARNALADIGRRMSLLHASRRLTEQDSSFIPLLIDTCTSSRFRFHSFGDFLTIAINLETWLVGKLANITNPRESPVAVQEATAGAAPPERATRRMSVKDADNKARELAAASKSRFYGISDRKQARMIGCSFATWKKTPFYPLATRNKRRPGINKSAGTAAPKVVSFTNKTQSQVGEGHRGEVLEQLIEDQEANFEPSPLANDQPDLKPMKVHSRKRL